MMPIAGSCRFGTAVRDSTLGRDREMAEALVVATGQSEGLAADAAAGEITHVRDQGLRSATVIARRSSGGSEAG